MQLHLNIPWKYTTEIIDTEWTNLQIGGGTNGSNSPKVYLLNVPVGKFGKLNKKTH